MYADILRPSNYLATEEAVNNYSSFSSLFNKNPTLKPHLDEGDSEYITGSVWTADQINRAEAFSHKQML